MLKTNLQQLTKNDLIDILKKEGLNTKGNKRELINRILNKNQKLRNYTQSYSKILETENNNIVKNKEEFIYYDNTNNTGNYIVTDFGKTRRKEITKKEFEQYIDKKGLKFTISNDIFKNALKIFNHLLENKTKDVKNLTHRNYESKQNKNNRLISIEPGSKNKNLAKKTIIDNDNLVKVKDNKCKDIKKKYNFNSKNNFKQIYKNKISKINPDICQSEECNSRYKNLNKIYKYYMNQC